MPGGGNLVNASIVGGNVHINNRGDVVFSGVVDTDRARHLHHYRFEDRHN